MPAPQKSVETAQTDLEPDPLFVEGYIGWTASGPKGRCAVALKDIPAGFTFERCPVIIMPWKDIEPRDGRDAVLDKYAFRWGPDKNRKSDHVAVNIAGSLMLYNHAQNPNAELVQNRAQNLMEIKARRPIYRGEEVTLDYDCDLWFDCLE